MVTYREIKITMDPIFVAVIGEILLVSFVIFMAFYTTRNLNKKSR